jgi:hypothetical protein
VCRVGRGGASSRAGLGSFSVSRLAPSSPCTPVTVSEGDGAGAGGGGAVSRLACVYTRQMSVATASRPKKLLQILGIGAVVQPPEPNSPTRKRRAAVTGELLPSSHKPQLYPVYRFVQPELTPPESPRHAKDTCKVCGQHVQLGCFCDAAAIAAAEVVSLASAAAEQEPWDGGTGALVGDAPRDGRSESTVGLEGYIEMTTYPSHEASNR